MLHKQLKSAFGLTALIGLTAPANAALVSLYEWGFNLDGAAYLTPAPLPAAINASGFNFSTGLGTITITLNTVGSHTVDVYLDHEIDESVNGFSNETGTASGSPAAGQSWEIDEPGFGTAYTGDIFDNFTASALDNQIFYDANTQQSGSLPDDVAMALGWDFLLAVDEIATMNFIVSETVPGSGFYLSQTDPNSNIYFYSTLTIQQGQGPSVPEPATALLLSIGLAGLAGRRYWRGNAC